MKSNETIDKIERIGYNKRKGGVRDVDYCY